MPAAEAGRSRCGPALLLTPDATPPRPNPTPTYPRPALQTWWSDAPTEAALLAAKDGMEDTDVPFYLVDLTANVTDVDANDNLTVSAVGTATNGNVSRDGDGIVYTPNANFFGTDTFTFTLVAATAAP